MFLQIAIISLNEEVLLLFPLPHLPLILPLRVFFLHHYLHITSPLTHLLLDRLHVLQELLSFVLAFLDKWVDDELVGCGSLLWVQFETLGHKVSELRRPLFLVQFRCAFLNQLENF